MLHAYQHAVSTRVPNEEHPALRYKSPLAGVQGHAVLHAYQHGVSLRALYEAAPRVLLYRPLPGRKGMQCCMPISTPYLYACLARRRPARRDKPPLAGAQGHAMLHAYQHGVSLRVRNEAAPRFTFFSCGLALRGLRHLRLRPDLSGL